MLELSAEGEAESNMLIDAELDIRYVGQSFTLTISCDWQQPDLASIQEAFHCAHQKQYGHRLNTAVELVNIRLAVKAPTLNISLPEFDAELVTDVEYVKVYGLEQKVPVYQRNQIKRGLIIEGPAIICEPVATTYLAPDWKGEVDRFGNLLLERLGL